MVLDYSSNCALAPKVPKWLDATPPRRLIRLVITGQLAVGKDTFAQCIDTGRYGCSDPLQLLCWGVYGYTKETPDGRKMLQRMGGILRGQLLQDKLETYVRLLRRAWCKMLDSGLCTEYETAVLDSVTWDKAGRPEFLACCADQFAQRFCRDQPGVWAVVGAREAAEVKYLLDRGYLWVHIMRANEARIKDLQASYGRGGSRALDGDLSEKFMRQVSIYTIEGKAIDLGERVVRPVAVRVDSAPLPSHVLSVQAFMEELRHYVNNRFIEQHVEALSNSIR